MPSGVRAPAVELSPQGRIHCSEIPEAGTLRRAFLSENEA